MSGLQTNAGSKKSRYQKAVALITLIRPFIAQIVVALIIFDWVKTDLNGITQVESIKYLGSLDIFHRFFWSGFIPTLIILSFGLLVITKIRHQIWALSISLLSGALCAFLPYFAVTQARSGIMPSVAVIIFSLFCGGNVAIHFRLENCDETYKNSIINFAKKLVGVSEIVAPMILLPRNPGSSRLLRYGLSLALIALMYCSFNLMLLMVVPSWSLVSTYCNGFKEIEKSDNGTWDIHFTQQGALVMIQGLKTLLRLDLETNERRYVHFTNAKRMKTMAVNEPTGKIYLYFIKTDDNILQHCLDIYQVDTLDLIRRNCFEHPSIPGGEESITLMTGTSNKLIGITKYSELLMDQVTGVPEKYSQTSANLYAVIDSVNDQVCIAKGSSPSIVCHDILTHKHRGVLRTKSQPDMLEFDPVTGYLYASFPLEALVRVIKPEKMEIIKEIPAFPGVRSIHLDKKNRLLFFGGFSPFLEVRNADDHTLFSRRYAPAWQRKMTTDPDSKTLYISSLKGVHQTDYADINHPSLFDRYDIFHIFLGMFWKLAIHTDLISIEIDSQIILTAPQHWESLENSENAAMEIPD